jgi:hypothetical protein
MGPQGIATATATKTALAQWFYPYRLRDYSAIASPDCKPSSACAGLMV